MALFKDNRQPNLSAIAYCTPMLDKSIRLYRFLFNLLVKFTSVPHILCLFVLVQRKSILRTDLYFSILGFIFYALFLKYFLHICGIHVSFFLSSTSSSYWYLSQRMLSGSAFLLNYSTLRDL